MHPRALLRKLALVASAAAPVAAAVGWFSGSILAGFAVEAVALAAGFAAAARRENPQPQFGADPLPTSSTGAQFFFELRGPKVARFVVTSDSAAPLLLPGVARGRADGLMIELVQDGKTLRLGPAIAPGEPVETALAPGARLEVEIDLALALGDLPRGPYAMKVRYDPRPFAVTDRHWRPPEAIVLGSFALIIPPWPSLEDLA